MKKALLLGGSHRDIPLIKAAQDLGYSVITLGDRNYYLGHNYSDIAYKIDFNDLEKVRNIITQENIDFLIPGCGEESYLNTVKLSEEFSIGNFDCMETASLLHHKWKFKEFCLKNDISTPIGIYHCPHKDFKTLTFPVVVKPVNLSGGRGVSIVNNFEELTQATQTAKHLSNEIFLEEFIAGRLIAYSVFIKNQKIIYAFTGADDTYLNKFLITTAYPIQLPVNVIKKLKTDVEKIATILNLVDGMFHLQVLIRDNTPYIIDITRRIPGDLYPYLIEYCDGVKYSLAVINAYTNVINNDEFYQKKTPQKFIIRHCVMPERNGVFKGLKINRSIKDNILDQIDLIRIGDKIDDYMNTQVSIILLEFKKYDETIVANINDLFELNIE